MTLAEQVASLRRTLHRLVSRRVGVRTRRPFQQLLALKAIEADGVRTQAALAERLLMDAPAVSRMVDRLEEEGLVRRCAGEDRRCVRLEVTEASLSETAVLREEVLWFEEEASRHLTASELRELKRLLEKLQTGLTQGQNSAEASSSGD
jgi:DNA-binding MarR family transcriptional regulator